MTVLTEMRDTMGLVLLSMGKDPSNFTDDDFGAAIAKLQKAVSDKQIRQFTGNDYAPLLGKGTVAACVAWSGDVIQLQADNKDIQFVTPDDRRDAVGRQHDDPAEGAAPTPTPRR